MKVETVDNQLVIDGSNSRLIPSPNSFGIEMINVKDVTLQNFHINGNVHEYTYNNIDSFMGAKRFSYNIFMFFNKIENLYLEKFPIKNKIINGGILQNERITREI